MRFGVSVDITRAVASLDALARTQVPFATSRALNAVAEKVVEAERHEMRDVFDRPTPYTLGSLRVIRSTKQRLEAVVTFKEAFGKAQVPASKYLAPNIKGGSRREKRFEAALRRAGVMPAGYRAVPGSGIRLDAYGNVPGSVIVKLLSYFKAFPEAGYRANITDKRKASMARGRAGKRYGTAYFVGRPGDGKLPFGIWERTTTGFGSAIRPVFLFVGWAQYQAIFDFEYVGRKTVEREFEPAFDRELSAAVASARVR